jgi:hypothetical protein
MATERIDDIPTPPAPKKPYRAPTLVRWGTLRDITQTVGRSGKDDHGDPRRGPSKTHY